MKSFAKATFIKDNDFNIVLKKHSVVLCLPFIVNNNRALLKFSLSPRYPLAVFKKDKPTDPWEGTINGVPFGKLPKDPVSLKTVIDHLLTGQSFHILESKDKPNTSHPLETWIVDSFRLDFRSPNSQKRLKMLIINSRDLKLYQYFETCDFKCGLFDPAKIEQIFLKQSVLNIKERDLELQKEQDILKASKLALQLEFDKGDSLLINLAKDFSLQRTRQAELSHTPIPKISFNQQIDVYVFSWLEEEKRKSYEVKNKTEGNLFTTLSFFTMLSRSSKGFFAVTEKGEKAKLFKFKRISVFASANFYRKNPVFDTQKDPNAFKELKSTILKAFNKEGSQQEDIFWRKLTGSHNFALEWCDYSQRTEESLSFRLKFRHSIETNKTTEIIFSIEKTDYGLGFSPRHLEVPWSLCKDKQAMLFSPPRTHFACFIYNDQKEYFLNAYFLGPLKEEDKVLDVGKVLSYLWDPESLGLVTYYYGGKSLGPYKIQKMSFQFGLPETIKQKLILEASPVTFRTLYEDFKQGQPGFCHIPQEVLNLKNGFSLKRFSALKDKTEIEKNSPVPLPFGMRFMNEKEEVVDINVFFAPTTPLQEKYSRQLSRTEQPFCWKNTKK